MVTKNLAVGREREHEILSPAKLPCHLSGSSRFSLLISNLKLFVVAFRKLAPEQHDVVIIAGFERVS